MFVVSSVLLSFARGWISSLAKTRISNADFHSDQTDEILSHY